MMYNKKKLGYQLVKVMGEKGFDQNKLAEVLGLTESAVSKVLNGHQALSVEQLQTCSHIFQKPADYFLSAADEVQTLELDFDALTDAQSDHVLSTMEIFIKYLDKILESKSVDIEEDIPARLKRLREDKKLSAKEMAERVGCSRTTIGNLEGGICKEKLEYLCSYAEILGVSLEYLIHGKIYGLPDGLGSDFKKFDFEAQTHLAGALKDVIEKSH